MLEQKLVTIIVPAFNAEDDIAGTLTSVQQQVYSNWECLVVNDGSTDGTASVVEKFTKSDPRFRLYNQQNKGGTAAKNKGLKNSNGAYIQYLDADDLLSADKINFQVEALQGKKKAVAVCKTALFTKADQMDNLKLLDEEFVYSTQQPIEFLLKLFGWQGKRGMIQPNAYLITRDLADEVGGWAEHLWPNPDDDGEYFTRVIAASQEIVATSGINYYRRDFTKNSLSRSMTESHAKGVLGSIESKIDTLRTRIDEKVLQEVFGQHLADFVQLYGSDYPSCILMAKNILKQKIKLDKFPPAGGKLFRYLVQILGMENAIRLRRLLKTP